MEKLHFFIKNIKFNAYENPPFNLIRKAGTNDYLLLLFKSYGEFTLDGVKYEYQPNSFVILKPHTPHSINTLDNLLQHDYIHFLVNDDEKLLQTDVPFNKFVQCYDMETVSDLIRLLYNEYIHFGTSIENAKIIDDLMNVILSYSIRSTHYSEKFSHQESHNLNKFNKIRASFYEEHNFPSSVKEIANLTYLSESRFSHLYTKFYNISPKKDIIRAKLQFGKHLLLTTDLSIKEISIKCGFSSEYVFIRTFKKNIGTTPNKWK